MTGADILLGTSGWSYTEWEGNFYRKGEKRKLRVYSRVFNTVEINSTFYRMPSKGTVLGWLRYSPSNFVFTAKIPKIITHDKKLGLKGDIKSDLEAFLEIMRPLQLGGKLACLLVQLPPSYDFNPQNLSSFFEQADSLFRYAVEFRHLSWMREETWQLLKERDIAYVNVDEPLLPPEVHLTSDLTYFRWHGRGERPWFNYRYSEDELDPWISKVKDVAAKTKRVYGYFNNHFHGYAPENCLKIMEKMGLLSEQQRQTIHQLTKQSKLGDFF